MVKASFRARLKEIKSRHHTETVAETENGILICKPSSLVPSNRGVRRFAVQN